MKYLYYKITLYAASANYNVVRRMSFLYIEKFLYKGAQYIYFTFEFLTRRVVVDKAQVCEYKFITNCSDDDDGAATLRSNPTAMFAGVNLGSYIYALCVHIYLFK